MKSLLTIILFLVIGCSKSDRQSGATGAGNPSPYTMTLKIEGRTTPVLSKITQASSIQIQDSAGTKFSVEKALIHIGRVRMKAEDDGCPTENCEAGWFVAEEGWTVDLISAESFPALPTFQVIPGIYHQLEIRVEKEDSIQYLPENVGLDLWLNTEKDGVPIRLHIPLSFDAEMTFENLDGVSLNSGESLLLWFNLNQWLQGVDVGACLMDESLEQISQDAWEVSDGSCGDIKSIVKENIKNSGKLE